MLTPSEKFDLIIDIENDLVTLTKECHEMTVVVKNLSDYFKNYITVLDDTCPTNERIFSLNPEISDDPKFLYETIRRLVEDEPLPKSVKQLLDIEYEEEIEGIVNSVNTDADDPAKALDLGCYMRHEIDKLVHNIRTKSSQLNENWTKTANWSIEPDEEAPENYYFFEIREEAFKTPDFLKSLIRMYAKEKRVPEDVKEYFFELKGRKQSRPLSDLHKTMGLSIRSGSVH